MKDAIYSQALLNGLVERHPMPLAQVKAAARDVLHIVKDGLLRDGSVRIQNFGTFKLKHIAEHQGRNPQTGETITIKAQNRVVFTPAKALRELIEPNRAKATPVVENTAVTKTAVKPDTADTIKPTRPVAPPASSANQESTYAPLTASPTQAVKSIPATEIKQPALSNNQDSKSSRKFYFWGTSSALIVIALIFLLQEDQEIISQPAMVNQPELTEQVTVAEQTMVADQTTMAETNKTDDQATLASQPVAVNQSTATIETLNTSTSVTEQIIIETDTGEEPLTVEDNFTTSSTATPAQQTSQENIPFFIERKHLLIRGDSLWHLAEKNYGDALLWTHIFQANQNSISNPDRLRIKHQILLPTLQGQPGELTQEDRYHIAEGYYLAYLHYKAIGDKDSFFALLEAKRYSAKLVKEKMGSLNLSLTEKLLLKHQPNL